MRILPFYWMLAIMFVLSSIMRDAGEMMVPMISSLAALWLARVLRGLSAGAFFGPMNIHFCYAIGWALGLAICVPYYFSGRWKKKHCRARSRRKLNTKAPGDGTFKVLFRARFLLLLFSTACPDKRRLNARLHQSLYFSGRRYALPCASHSRGRRRSRVKSSAAR